MRTFIITLVLTLASWSAPAFAAPPEVSIHKVQDGVWRHISFHTFDNGARLSSNGLIVEDAGRLYLIDSAWGDDSTETLLDLIDAEIGLPVVAAVATHSHADRAAGAALMATRGIAFYALEETRRLAPRWGLVAPAQALPLEASAGASTRLGPLEIFYPGTGHTKDNLMVWLPKHKLLFGGCAVREAASHDLGYHKEGDPAAWRNAMALTRARYAAAETVIPGHGASGGPELLAHTSALLDAHLAKVR
ncbi:subclass B1 metallo-beta-lactamase [Kordiimonas sp.]|uniref:subclass B1 metallo-beta-lactamase n=1 Tax=Kordiimonas sp. TaxID=1970157 RepID=UPI003A9169E1